MKYYIEYILQQYMLKLLKISLLTLTFTLFYSISTLVFAKTLDEVKNRGYLKCGVSDEDFIGFSSINDLGKWKGFDIDLCKSIAIAIFGDSDKVEFLPMTSRSRFPSLAFKEIDVLIRNTTWSFSRDVNLEFEFTGINFYDGQAFMVSKSFNINSILDLDDAKICIVSGTSYELNIKNFFNKNLMDYEPLILNNFDEAKENYINGNCDALTSDLSVLAVLRLKIPDSSNHMLLPEIISKEPLGPVVRQDDGNWIDIIRWVLNVLIIAEEKNLNQNNVKENLQSTDKEVLRILGVIGNYGNMLELEDDWAYNIIEELGNYGVIFEKNLGRSSALELERGLNKLWTKGGILYAPPFR